MIHALPGIMINGGNQLFGGYIYDVNVNISAGSEGSSSISLSIVNSTGVYNFSPTNLSLATSYIITIGSTNYKMYAKRIRKKQSAKGYVLEVEFTDGSFKLDKYFVGLHKKHGYKKGLLGTIPKGYSLTNPNCFIIVGREFHDCDINNDGTVDILDITDPCHPCNQEQTTLDKLRQVDCDEVTKYNIFEVKYNFTELIQAIKDKGFSVLGATDPNPKYFKEHVGSLREVLSAWCHHFGWIFFWENDTIKFKDLRAVSTVNANISNFCPDIENFEEEYTLDGTFDKMILTNFSRAGQDKDYDCHQAIYITMPGYTQFNAPSNGLEIDPTIDYDAAGLAYYDKGLRDLYYLYIKNGMIEANKYFPGKEIPQLGLTILSDPFTLNPQNVSVLATSAIEPSTSLDKPSFSKHRVSIYDQVPTDSLLFLDDATDVGPLSSVRNSIKSNVPFLECFKLLDEETKWRVAGNINKYFFFVAHYDSKIDNLNYDAERDFAENFIGKYHIFLPNLYSTFEREFFEDYTFYVDPTCHQRLNNDDRVRYDFLGDTGGASLTYYNNVGFDEGGDRQTLGDLPFSRFLRVVNGEIASYAGATRPFKLVVVEKGGQDFYPSNISSDADTSSIFQNSGKNWLIQDDGIKNQAHSYYIKFMPGTSNDIGENVARLILGSNATNVDRNKLYICLGYAPGKDAFQYTRADGYSPLFKAPVYFNGDPLNLEIDPITHKVKQELIYRYPKLKCLPLAETRSQGACDVAHFKTPVGEFQFYFPSDGIFECVLQKTRRVFKKILKYESVKIGGVCDSGNTLSLQVDPISIRDDDISKFLKLGTNTCVYNESKINLLHDAYLQNLGTSQKTPLIKRTFTVGGILNTTLGISDGLQNISITTAEDGVRSTYTFGTTHFLLPDLDVYSGVKDNIDILKFARSNDVNGAPTLVPK